MASLSPRLEDRVLKRNRDCLGVGALAGATAGLLMGLLLPASAVVLSGAGALAGAVIGRLVAAHVIPEEWDPPSVSHEYVGTNSPDDDIARD